MMRSEQQCIYRFWAPVAAALIAGITAGAWRPGCFRGVLGVFLITALVSVRNILTRRHRLAGPLLLCLSAGYLSIQPWLTPCIPDSHINRFQGNRTWQIQGKVVDEPQQDGQRWRFVLAAEKLQRGKTRKAVSGQVLVSGWGQWPGAVRGDRVCFSGRLRAFRNFANPGGFDYKRYMAFQAVRTRTYARNGTLKISSPSKQRSWLNWLDSKRDQLAAQMESALKDFPLPTVQLLKALLLGQRDQISDAMRLAFSRSGTGHVLAISGLHIGMVAGVSFAAAHWILTWIPLIRRYAWSRKAAALACLWPVVGYALLAGLSASTQRALLMVVVVLAGYWVGRRHDWFNTLSLAAFIILVVHPPALFGISFQLSFMAVLAILAGMTVSADASPAAESTVWQKGGLRFKAFIKVSVLAVLGTLPLVLYDFNQVSLVGVIVNLVVVPVVAMVVVPAGLTGVIMAQLNLDLAAFLWKLSALGGELIRCTVEWTAQWPWAAVRCVTPSGFEIILFYLFVALVFFRKKILHFKAALCVLLALGTLDAGYWVYQRFGVRQLRVTAIDVGQGTANLIEFPGGYTALVDGGGFSGSSSLDVGAAIVAPLLWRQKIRTLDWVVLSHANSDHLNGLLFILENFHVKEVWSNGEPATGASFKAWKRQLAQSGAKHLAIGRIPIESNINGVQRTVLAPPADFLQRADKERWRDLNNNSLVLRLAYGNISILFTGDIMDQAEADLVARKGRQGLQSTILMVPHHGSRKSSTLSFLKAVQPEEAIISAGWKNRFGFPHGEVLDRLNKIGATIRCTADEGAIRIITDGQTYDIQTGRSP